MSAKAKGEFDIDSVSPEELEKLVNKAGGQRQFSRKYGVARSTLQLRLHKIVRDPFGHRPAPEAIHHGAPETGVARYILTSAQDGTRLHEGFLTNLEAYREHFLADGPCEIMIAGFTYNKTLFEEHGKNKVFWPERIKPYMRQERVRIADRLDWCAEMNTLPTAVTPLSGFETYTRHRWGIFPHVKVQLKSVPTMRNSPAKIIMTTGAVTLPNYVPKRAGIKASFHHVLGAVLVEVAPDGRFFCRHLLADDDGSFYDLDRHIKDGVVTENHRVLAINWGDLHVSQIDPVVAETCFGIAPTDIKGPNGRIWNSAPEGHSMLDRLRPQYQFFHDVADFQSRNHHNIADPHLMYELFVRGVDSVETELREVAMFTSMTRRDWCETVVVESNHDLALTKWLKNADYRYDPQNARFFLECQLACYRAIERGDPRFSIFEDLLTNHFGAWRCENVRFLREDESFVIAGIEKGMHGHLGANGARGTPAAFTKMGPKATTGHTHSCEIRDGIYTSGTSSKLFMGYNKGLSSWTHSHVVTLANGKRQIITMQDGLWRL